MAQYLYPQAHIADGDIAYYYPNRQFDIVVGNPPYGLRIGEEASELFYLNRAASLLKPGGLLAVVTPKFFLSDELLHGKMVKELNKSLGYLCQFSLPADAFRNMGVEQYETKLMLFYRVSPHLPVAPYNFKRMEASADWSSKQIYETFIVPLEQAKEKMRMKLHREALSKHSQEFSERVTKLLFDIRRNGKVGHRIRDALDMVERYYTQQKPHEMTEKEWNQVRLHSRDVLRFLKAVLQQQNMVERDEIRLVKTDDGLKLKAYSEKTKQQLALSQERTYMSLNQMVVHRSYHFADQSYKKLYRRKRTAYELQTTPYDEMKPDEALDTYLYCTGLTDYVNEDTVYLNDKQAADTNLFLQKRYAFAQWSQGTGKTITGIFQALYRKKQVRNVIVVSTAISIKNNWREVLAEQFELDHIMIESIADFRRIRDGQIILITFDMLIRLKRQMQKFVKMKSRKLFFICDESDALSNPTSSRTLAAGACFRRMKYKLFLTGTSTRNNIAEFYPQLELLYNNSVNMLCTCETIYERDRDGSLNPHRNPYLMEPYPPYLRGSKLFSACFLPDKITVLGIGQKTQDIYNSDELKNLLAYTVITRTFEEIVGRKLYELHQKLCDFKSAEIAIYETALKEYNKLEYLFGSTGNTRKDAALKILNQLILLLRICAAPQTIPEYDKSVLPGKQEVMLEMLEDWKNERVAIGVRHVNVVQIYATEIRKRFPDRPVIEVTGDKVSLAKRKDIIRKMRAMPTAVLVCTQQSLSCSVNIDYIDKCLIPELHYNNSGMSQFYFRFIRYTSKNMKHIYFLTCKNSIESNLLKMVTAKEKLNYFMRQTELNDAEVYEKFGIAPSMLQNLMYKERTKDGVQIRWGEQMIA